MSPEAQRRQSPRRTWYLRVIALFVCGVVVGLAIFATLTALKLSSNVRTVDLNTNASEGALADVADYSGAFDVLLVGSDSRVGQGAKYGEGGDVEGARNDVTLVLHVDANHTHGTILSIPRDLLIDFPECTNPETGRTAAASRGVQFNEGLGRGGLACVASSVEALTGWPIRYAAEVSFQGVIDLSKAIGGVPMCFLGPINDPHSGLSIPAAGTYSLEGDDALALLRSRHGVGDGSDLARISTQQAFLASLARKLKEESTLTSLPTLYAIADAVTRNMVLSNSLADPITIIGMAKAFSDISLESLSFVTYPYLPYGNRVVPDREASDELLRLISADQPLLLDPDHIGRGSVAEKTETGAGGPADTDPTPEPAPGGGNTQPDTHATPDATTPKNTEGQTASRQSCVLPY